MMREDRYPEHRHGHVDQRGLYNCPFLQPRPLGLMSAADDVQLAQATITLPSVTPVVSGATVALRSVVVVLGVFPALSGLDLEAGPGEVVLLRGPNGAGKTTVLRACAGLVAVQRGDISVLGCDLRKDRRLVRRRIGLLGHATSLYEDLTVEQNVRFAVRAAAGDVDRIPAALERLGLGGRLRSLGVVHLSAGQRRRVALAALVARMPRLWLLDEPHAGLDPDGRDLLDEVIGEAAAIGTTVLLASHDVDRATRIASRVVLISGGRVVTDSNMGRCSSAALPCSASSTLLGRHSDSAGGDHSVA